MATLGGIQVQIQTALAAASWCTTAGYTVFVEGNSDTFTDAVNAALGDKGICIIVCPPSDLKGEVSMSGGRVDGVVSVVCCLVSTGDTITTLPGIVSQMIETVRSTLTHALNGVDFGRVADEESQLGYYVSFDILVNI